MNQQSHVCPYIYSYNHQIYKDFWKADMSQHHHAFDRTTFYEGDEVWAPDAASNTIKKAIVIFSDLSAKKSHSSICVGINKSCCFISWFGAIWKVNDLDLI